MKKLLVLAAVSLVATSAYAGEMKWSGSTDWRYDQTKLNDDEVAELELLEKMQLDVAELIRQLTQMAGM